MLQSTPENGEVATVKHANQVDSDCRKVGFHQFTIRSSDILQPPFMTMNPRIRRNNVNASILFKRKLEQLEHRRPRGYIRFHEYRFSMAISAVLN